MQPASRTCCFRLGDSSTPNLEILPTVVNLQNGKVSGAIVADQSAPDLPMGEGSIALAVALGIDADPRRGGVEKGVAHVIYPGSGNGKSRGLKEIGSNSREYFRKWSGIEKLKGCIVKRSK